MEKWRHMDGSSAIIEAEHFRIVFQHGNPEEVGTNGCSIEDVIETLIQKLLDFQGRALACDENAQALFHLAEAQEALLKRRNRRREQGILGVHVPHQVPDTVV